MNINKPKRPWEYYYNKMKELSKNIHIIVPPSPIKIRMNDNLDNTIKYIDYISKIK